MAASAPHLLVQIQREWSADRQQLRNLSPATGRAVLITWTEEPAHVDSGVPDRIKRALADCLTGVGKIAFRWAGEVLWSSRDALVIKPTHQNVVSRLAGRFLNNWPSDIVVTQSSTVASRLFDHDWELQGQAALVLASDWEMNEPVLSDLAILRDWTDFRFCPKGIALLVPSVDGGGALLTVASDGQLATLVSLIEAALVGQGVEFASP